MFHYASRHEIVRATTEQNRSFATIGLLRQVTEATPIDLVCTYIVQTKQPWGLRDMVTDLKYAKQNIQPTYHDYVTVRDNKRADRLRSFPSGIVKMSKDYLIRAFWKNIDHLRSSSCMKVTTDGTTAWGSGREGQMSRIRLFPKDVLNVLAACHISHNSRLWDAQHAIGALHAVCTPLMMEKPNWVRQGRYGYHCIDENQFGALQNKHSRAISALISVLDGYCWNITNRQSIPNESEKNILLDLIESFLVMFGPEPFEENFRIRQLYEYSRLSSLLSSAPDRRGDCCCGGGANLHFKERRVTTTCGGNKWQDGALEICSRLQNLSPEAAICLNNITDFWSTCSSLSPLVLKEIHPMPSKEVEVYLYTELQVQRQKCNAVLHVRDAIEHGEFNDDHHDIYVGYGNTGDCPCEPAPCDPCCS